MTHLYTAYKRFTSEVRMHRYWKWKGWRKVIPKTSHEQSMRRKWKEAGIAIVVSDKINFEMTILKGFRNGHHLMIKVPIQQENNIYKYICTQNRSTKIIKPILTDLKGEIDSITKIVRDFNTPLTPMDWSSRQRINEEIMALTH